MQRSGIFQAGLFQTSGDKIQDAIDNVKVVQDTNPDNPALRNWRYTAQIIEYNKQDLSGLEGIYASSSAAPRAEHFKWIAEQVIRLSNGNVKCIVDLDLREEPHAYVNGEAFTYATTHNWFNLGKTESASLEAESQWMESIRAQGCIPNVITNEQHKSLDFNGRAVTIETVQSEKQIAESAGFLYKRLMASDHMKPRPEVLDEFLAFYKSLPPGTWIHLHCRGGEGRSTTYLTIIDMLNNADKLSFNTIIERQASIPPYYHLSQMTRRCPELTPYYRERYEFINQFYDFARDLKCGYTGTWSKWISELGNPQPPTNQLGI